MITAPLDTSPTALRAMFFGPDGDAESLAAMESKFAVKPQMVIACSEPDATLGIDAFFRRQQPGSRSDDHFDLLGPVDSSGATVFRDSGNMVDKPEKGAEHSSALASVEEALAGGVTQITVLGHEGCSVSKPPSSEAGPKYHQWRVQNSADSPVTVIDNVIAQVKKLKEYLEKYGPKGRKIEVKGAVVDDGLKVEFVA